MEYLKVGKQTTLFLKITSIITESSIMLLSETIKRFLFKVKDTLDKVLSTFQSYICNSSLRIWIQKKTRRCIDLEYFCVPFCRHVAIYTPSHIFNLKCLRILRVSDNRKNLTIGKRKIKHALVQTTCNYTHKK